MRVDKIPAAKPARRQRETKRGRNQEPVQNFIFLARRTNFGSEEGLGPPLRNGGPNALPPEKLPFHTTIIPASGPNGRFATSLDSHLLGVLGLLQVLGLIELYIC